MTKTTEAPEDMTVEDIGRGLLPLRQQKLELRELSQASALFQVRPRFNLLQGVVAGREIFFMGWIAADYVDDVVMQVDFLISEKNGRHINIQSGCVFFYGSMPTPLLITLWIALATWLNLPWLTALIDTIGRLS